MNKNLIRIPVAIGAAVVLAVILGVIWFMQLRAAMAKYANFQMPPESVTSLVVQSEEWVPALRTVGSTAAVQGVMVSTDQPGIVTKINFESGQTVKAGDLLVQLDIAQEEAQLRSALAQQKLAALNLQRQQNLMKSRVSAQADLDTAQAQYDQTSAAVLEMKSHVDRKTIRAPFSGVIGIRLVNLGQYLQSGAEVASLQALDPIYVNFWLPQQNLNEIAPGQKVIIRVDGIPGVEFEGKINAVDSVIAEATRNARVQATFSNEKSQLRPGMFVNVDIPLDKKENSVVVPVTSIQYAPYGDMVYIIEDLTDEKTGKTYRGVRQQVVKVGESRGDRVVILSGVNPGEEVVTSGVFKLRPGSHVKVNNAIEPGNSDTPNPEDT